MGQFDKSEKEENASCSGVDLAAHALSLQAFSRGTLSAENTRGSDCAKVPQFSSTDDALAEVQRRHAAGLPAMNGFELTGADNDTKSTRDLLYAMEDRLNKKLDFTFFRADNGNMEVFILGMHDRSNPTDLHIGQAKNDKSAPAACVDIGDTVDANLNLQLRLPPGTLEKDAVKVSLDRKHQRELVREGIDPDASADDVARIKADRAAMIAKLPVPDQNSPDYARYLADKEAINVGLQPGASEEQIKAARADSLRQSEAIQLGLNRFATAGDISMAQKQIDNTIDVEYNAANLLPSTATRQEGFQIMDQRAHDSGIVGRGLDPSMSREERDKISSARQSRISELQGQEWQPGVTDEQRQQIQRQIDAVSLGLAENSSKEEIEATKQRYAEQSLAVMIGLSKDATSAEIQAALARQREYDDRQIPHNLCEAKPEEQKQDEANPDGQKPDVQKK